MAAQGELESIGAALRTPRAAAVSGLVFAGLLIAVLVLVTLATPSRPATPGSWLHSSSNRRSLSVALGLVPFAGIAFLWFIGVVRDRIGQLEDRFFATVFLGSGLLFIAILFVAAAIGTAILSSTSRTAAPSPSLAEAREVVGALIHSYGLRMAGVFTMSTATILHRTRVAPRWIAVLGFASAVVLLFGIGLSPWLELLFPAWIGLLSGAILWFSVRADARVVGAGPG
jgi:hypothetical protein